MPDFFVNGFSCLASGLCHSNIARPLQPTTATVHISRPQGLGLAGPLSTLIAICSYDYILAPTPRLAFCWVVEVLLQHDQQRP